MPDIRTSSSVVAAADIDLDGTQEIFIGGRVVPGKYPLSPNSFIIKKIILIILMQPKDWLLK